MNWEALLTPIRLGKERKVEIYSESARTEFQRDYDRIIFSSPFRRLQNKTQVFPLPGSVFVHNRLTHSLEVASVGRSLGNVVSSELKKKTTSDHPEFLNEIGSIVSAASLSHDLGNPPFGHAGEEAISRFFVSGKGTGFQSLVTEAQWSDLTNFEGNANAFRLLTHQFNGRRKGGFALTYATLASLIKYPFSSLNRSAKNKYGYFTTEVETFQTIAKKVGLVSSPDNPGIFSRHPLVYLVEAADDISYQIMDIEDAHKLGILSSEFTIELFLNFFDKEKNKSFFTKKSAIFKEVTDTNEQIAFLRASVINLLILEVARIFVEHENELLKGSFSGSMVDYFTGSVKNGMEQCTQVAISRVYKHRSVVEVEITGFTVLNTLLEEFTAAQFNQKSNYSKKLLLMLPLQYREEQNNDYGKLRSVLDFISGMTDLYALDLYKLIKGIGI